MRDITFINRKIYEEVFKVPATEKRHIKYKLSIMEVEEQE